jgi:hypothetical protein
MLTMQVVYFMNNVLNKVENQVHKMAVILNS